MFAITVVTVKVSVVKCPSMTKTSRNYVRCGREFALNVIVMPGFELKFLEFFKHDWKRYDEDQF